MTTIRKWRVIAQPVVTVILRERPTASSPQEAVDKTVDNVDWYQIFRSVNDPAIAHIDFADGFDAFVVDPIGEDGEPDTKQAIWLANDGETVIQPCQTATEVHAVQKLAEACRTVLTDAQMALCGEWDRGDEGFEAQVEMLQAALNMANQVLGPACQATIVIEVEGGSVVAVDNLPSGWDYEIVDHDLHGG